jgi:hypothetical protein
VIVYAGRDQVVEVDDGHHVSTAATFGELVEQWFPGRRQVGACAVDRHPLASLSRQLVTPGGAMATAVDIDCHFDLVITAEEHPFRRG